MKKDMKKIEEYASIQKWFIKPSGERRYTPSTEKQYIEYMKLWCSLTGKTPDELAECEDISKVRGIIAEGMRDKCHLSIRSITYRIHPLNSFWRYNGRQTNKTYSGIRNDIRRHILRSKRLRPETTKEFIDLFVKEKRTET